VTVRQLPRVLQPKTSQPSPVGDEHPIRRLTREVAFDQEAWTPEQAADLGVLFDQLAPEWHTRAGPERLLPLLDAVERGGPFADGLAIELGSGTGLATAAIAERFPRLVAVDLSMEMLRLAPAVVPRVRADGSALPLAEASVATLLLNNMLLFPAEVDRVLAPDGVLVWVNTLGPHTPIHLSPSEIDAALPGEWNVIASEAGWGTWCVARRDLAVVLTE
jgi:SAM-dependent methyltransferase